MEATPPQATAPTFEAALAQLGRHLDRMTGKQQGTGKELRHLSDELTGLRARIEELESLTSRLDGRFTEILAERHQQEKPDTLTQEAYGQYQLAEDLKTLFLDIDRDYRAAHQRAMKTGPTAEHRANMLHHLLNWQLTDNLESESELTKYWNNGGAGRGEITALIPRIAELRREAEALDPSCEFSFEFGPEAAYGGSYVPWSVCDPEDEARYAVTPAYVVGPRCYLPPQVYTSPVDPG
ncbi:hypothetical protein ACFO3J_00345 [Streptomyces polygonati]|uniref:Uncharacterized protein n=1 Tax=Streptomyces polygonati TaxID=1617087 RepID=A0ABV8HCY5_9ACTN